MGPRAPRPVERKARALASEVHATGAVQRHVAARVDGFLEVAAEPLPERQPVRQKVERRLRQLHPMD